MQGLDATTLFFIVLLIIAVIKIIADTSEAVGGTFLDSEQQEKYQQRLGEIQKLIKEEEHKLGAAALLSFHDKMNSKK